MRVVALGASNLTRGFPTLVAAARARWGRDVEVLAALGLGRSYGAPSRILVRTLPGILQSGLWSALDELPRAPLRALVTDVGNDVLYGFHTSQILAWVEECVARLSCHSSDVILTGLPLASLRRQSFFKLLLLRSILVPQCRLPPAEILRRAEELNAGLEALAEKRSLRFFRLEPDWYGFDPIHVRPGRWGPAWREILLGDESAGPGMGVLEALRLQARMPDRQWFLGLERRIVQSGVGLPGGGKVSLY